MSHVTIMNRSQLFAAATAISAVGFLAVPAPAHAGPMFPLPLAPPCNQYVFNGDFSIRQDDGWQVFFSSTGPAAGGRAVAVGDNNVDKLTGVVSGGGIQGRNVDFTIRWDNSPSVAHLTGVVGDDALVHKGVTIDQSSAKSAYWDSTHPLGCSSPAAPPPAPDPQVVLAPGVKNPPPHDVGPQAPPGPPAPAVATVISDVDIYDVPGGNGNRIGILRSGRQVKLVGTCKPNDWCDVVIPELPGGSGWVWDQFLKF